MPSREEVEVHLAEFDTDIIFANLHSNVAVIVTHPWGPLGGNMHNNVVMAVVLYFQRLGVTTVRFNFAGSQLGRGNYQVNQVQTIAEKVLSGELFQLPSTSQQQQQPTNTENNNDNNEDSSVLPKYILLVGYSYGSLIAGSASAEIPQCIGTVSIAPPFGVQHWLLLFNSNHHLKRAATRQEPFFKRLFILGSNDNFTSESKFESTIDRHFLKTNIDGNNANTGAILKDADHFLFRREKDVMDIIGQWLRTTAYPNHCPHGDLQQFRKIDIDLQTSPPVISSSSSTNTANCNIVSDSCAVLM